MPSIMLSALDSQLHIGDVISFRAVEFLLLHLDKTLTPSRDGLSRGTLLTWDPVIEQRRGCLAGGITWDTKRCSDLFISLSNDRDSNLRWS